MNKKKPYKVTYVIEYFSMARFEPIALNFYDVSEFERVKKSFKDNVKGVVFKKITEEFI